jgi:hypothetical protein
MAQAELSQREDSTMTPQQRTTRAKELSARGSSFKINEQSRYLMKEDFSTSGPKKTKEESRISPPLGPYPQRCISPSALPASARGSELATASMARYSWSLGRFLQTEYCSTRSSVVSIR